MIHNLTAIDVVFFIFVYIVNLLLTHDNTQRSKVWRQQLVKLDVIFVQKKKVQFDVKAVLKSFVLII